MGRLQRHDGAECELFREVAEQGHYAGRTLPTNTRQGIYATAPSGVLLASVNTRSSREVARMLQRALSRWNDLPDSQRYLDETRLEETPEQRRWERNYPTDGMVLKSVSRDLPRDDTGRGWKRHAWNRDYVWFRSDEMKSLVPQSLEIGAQRVVPRVLAHRLVRLHLQDNVRGQVRAFGRGDVKDANWTTMIEHIDDDVITLRIEGQTRAVNPGRDLREGEQPNPEQQERGVEMTLLGHATFDRATESFTEFEMIALGTRWGGTKYNGRERDLEPAGIGILFTLAPDDPPVAPAYIWEYGWPRR